MIIICFDVKIENMSESEVNLTFKSFKRQDEKDIMIHLIEIL